MLISSETNLSQVALLDLEVLAEIASSPAGKKYPPKQRVQLENPAMEKALSRAVDESQNMTCYFTQFLVSLMQLFSTDRQLLEDRGSFIIRSEHCKI